MLVDLLLLAPSFPSEMTLFMDYPLAPLPYLCSWDSIKSDKFSEVTTLWSPKALECLSALTIDVVAGNQDSLHTFEDLAFTVLMGQGFKSNNVKILLTAFSI